MLSKPWNFAADPNADGLFTISDIGTVLSQLYHLPGNTVIYLTIKHAPAVATFFEFDSASYSDWFSTIASLVGWLVAIPVAIIFFLHGLTPITDSWNGISSSIKERIEIRQKSKWRAHKRKLGYEDEDE